MTDKIFSYNIKKKKIMKNCTHPPKIKNEIKAPLPQYKINK